MKSNLAYINDHVDRMLDLEVKSPTPHSADLETAMKPRIIAGFEVRDEAREKVLLEEAREKRREVVQKYRENKRELMDSIAETGAKPLAVLPTTMFHLICRQSGLYYVPRLMRTEVNPTHFLTWLNTPVGLVVDSASWTGAPARTVRQMRKGAAQKTPESYLEEFGREEVLKHLLTLDRTEFTTPIEEEARRRFRDRMGYDPMPGTILNRPQASPTDGKMYDLVLPIPPAEVCDTLMKIADFNPQTVCVYGAVDFKDGGVIPILYKVKQDHIDREKAIEERVNWMLHDPIVYITAGKVTAVMAQFGPFPVEQALIDRITAAEFLPQS